MNDLLRKRVADMLVLDLFESQYLIKKAEKPFIDIGDFSAVTGMDRQRIYKLLYNDLCGLRELVFGSYDKYLKYNKGNKLYFDTGKVIEWLKNR